MSEFFAPRAPQLPPDEYERSVWQQLHAARKEAREAATALTAAQARIRELEGALAEATEFADQDAQALTAAGIALVGRWRRALKEAQP